VRAYPRGRAKRLCRSVSVGKALFNRPRGDGPLLRLVRATLAASSAELPAWDVFLESLLNVNSQRTPRASRNGQLLGQQQENTTRNLSQPMDDPGVSAALIGLLDHTWTPVCGFLNRVRRFESYRGHYKMPAEVPNR
jgi:hypothetical protein